MPFKEKQTIAHLAEAKKKGFLASEMHGTRMPGSLSAAIESAQEAVIILLLVSIVIGAWPFTQMISVYLVCLLGLFIWKIARSAYLGWSQLERLHRLLEEERWEIEHNRSQEREELKILYEARGFEGKLLEDVLDVLMADGDRLLQVMMEEEFGLPLGLYEHPLQQGLGAGLGVALSGLIFLLGLWIWPWGGPYLAALLTLFATGYLSAYFEGNRLIPAVVWNMAIAFLALGSAQFLWNFLRLFYG